MGDLSSVSIRRAKSSDQLASEAEERNKLTGIKKTVGELIADPFSQIKKTRQDEEEAKKKERSEFLNILREKRGRSATILGQGAGGAGGASLRGTALSR